MPEGSLTLIDSFDDVEAFWRWCGERHSVLAVDTETGGFSYLRDPLRLVQVGSTDRGWAMRWDRWSGLFECFVKDYAGRLVMHNWKFDAEFITHNGVSLPMHRIEDTRTMAHLVDPMRMTGLKPLADSLLFRGASGSGSRLHRFMKSHKWGWRDLPFDLQEYWAYACIDPMLTAGIFEVLDAQLTPARRALYEVEMAAQMALMKMEMKGARVDKEYASEKAIELRQYAYEVRRWAQEEHGKGFNLGSTAQLAALLTEQHGWEPKELTPTGKAKLTKEIVESLPFPIARLHVKMKHAEKMAAAFFDNFVDMADDHGFLHPSINPIGARTGRMSMRDPNLQQLPRTEVMRNAFIPRDGNKLVLVDYDAMEVKLTAHFDESGELVQAALTEPDIHRYTASKIYGIDMEDVTPKQRQTAKNGIYTVIYGGGSGKLADTVGITAKEAKRFMTGFFDLYPGVKDWRARTEREGLANMEGGFVEVETPRGRRQRTTQHKAYKLVNYLIQGSGADVLKTKIAELDAAGFDEYMILPVHDEIVFDVPADMAEEVMQGAMRIMRDPTWKVPLTVSGGIYDRWGHKYRKAS